MLEELDSPSVCISSLSRKVDTAVTELVREFHCLGVPDMLEVEQC